MSLFNTEQRYGRVSLALHWLMLVLLIVIYVCMEFRGYFPKGSVTREGMKAWHYMLGLSGPLLVAVRLAERAAGERRARRLICFHDCDAGIGMADFERGGQTHPVLRS